jgi:hypothetical protein
MLQRVKSFRRFGKHFSYRLQKNFNKLLCSNPKTFARPVHRTFVSSFFGILKCVDSLVHNYSWICVIVYLTEIYLCMAYLLNYGLVNDAAGSSGRLASHDITKLERCRPNVWSTLKFKRCSSRHITDDDVSRATKGVANATVV